MISNIPSGILHAASIANKNEWAMDEKALAKSNAQRQENTDRARNMQIRRENESTSKTFSMKWRLGINPRAAEWARAKSVGTSQQFTIPLTILLSVFFTFKGRVSSAFRQMYDSSGIGFFGGKSI